MLSQDQPLVKKTLNPYIKIIALLSNELRKNRFAFLIPLPFLIYLATAAWYYKTLPPQLGLNNTWTFLIVGAALALVYGLQSFSSEADKKTLDFILTRPIAPWLILATKYLISITILCGWLIILKPFCVFDLSKTPLPKGMGVEWFFLLFILIHATSFFSGLLAKGLERFFVVITMTLFMASGSYFLWLKIFKLLAANYFWYDIPTQQLSFISLTFPIYLMVISIALPLVGTLWFLRSRIPLWKFSPARWLLGIWILSYLLVSFIEYLFAPVLWPNINAKYGAWHHDAGIVLVSGAKESPGKKAKTFLPTADELSFNLAGKKPRVILKGQNLSAPIFSPDGKKLVFAANGRLRLWDLKSNKISTISNGQMASWSQDSQKLICAQVIGAKGYSKLYQLDLRTGKKTPITPKRFNLTDICWDSEHHSLFLIGIKNDISMLNLVSGNQQQILWPESRKPRIFSINKPTVVLLPQDNLILIGQEYNQDLEIYYLDSRTGKFRSDEEFSDLRIKERAPLIINDLGTAMIWSRYDGSFVYQVTNLLVSKQHELGDHHGEGDEHED